MCVHAVHPCNLHTCVYTCSYLTAKPEATGLVLVYDRGDTPGKRDTARISWEKHGLSEQMGTVGPDGHNEMP